MKSWILFIGIILVLLLTQCVTPPKFVKWGSVSTQAVPDIYDYQIKFTKLPSGTIPANSSRVLVGDETEITLAWPKSTTLKPYNEQLDPTTFGQSSDSTTYTIPDADVTYNDVETLNASAQVPNLSLSAGEYQIQIKNSIWSTYYNKRIYSKYSNAIGLYVDHTTDPLVAPAQITIKVQ